MYIFSMLALFPCRAYALHFLQLVLFVATSRQGVKLRKELMRQRNGHEEALSSQSDKEKPVSQS